MGWFKNLFTKKDQSLLSFSIVKENDDFSAKWNLNDRDGFLDFLRNKHQEVDIQNFSDEELVQWFMFNQTKDWLSENLQKPLFIEAHELPAHGEIKYSRNWNKSFIERITKMGWDVLPASEEELVDMYMNYVYGTRLMDEMEAMAEANPQSIAHPELSNPNNRFKG